jgi:hypothetical protein
MLNYISHFIACQEPRNISSRRHYQKPKNLRQTGQEFDYRLEEPVLTSTEPDSDRIGVDLAIKETASIF